jgi:hypothetical protein
MTLFFPNVYVLKFVFLLVVTEFGHDSKKIVPSMTIDSNMPTGLG